MKRFGASDRGSVLRELVRPVLLFVLVLAVLLVGIGRLNAASLEEELATAEEAVRRAAVQCYAVEGSYPPNLDYIKEHYGLAVDESRFVIHYQPVGANLMPQIAVIPLEQQPGQE